MKRKCSKCKIEKTIDSFSRDKYRKSGYVSQCKDCRNKYCQKYYSDNIELIRIKKNNYCKSEHGKKKRRAYSKKNYKKNKEKLLLNNKIWREKNKKYRKQYLKNYCLKNRSKINKFDRKKRKNPKIRLDQNISRGINYSLKKIGFSKKQIGWEKAVGYTINQLVNYIEKNLKME